MYHCPVRSIESGRLASLAFLLYEICITLDKEVKFIWSKPNNSWVKWQYLFTRYFALTALMANRFVEATVTMQTDKLPNALRNWFSCQVLIGGALMSSVELVLMARVYAMYNSNIYVGYAYFFIFFCEIVSIVVGIATNTSSTNSQEIYLVEPDSFVYFSITAIVSQVIILLLTILKYRSAVKAGWSKSPIVNLMIRDGSLVFIIILFVTIWTLLSALTDKYVPIGDSWFLAIISCAGCRLVINLQQYVLPKGIPFEQSGFGIQLTTLGPQFDDRSVSVNLHSL